MQKVINQLIGQNIRNLREKRGFKQGDLAKVINRTRSSISNIEQGIQTLQIGDLYKLAEFFDVEVSSILPTLQEIKLSNSTTKTKLEYYKHTLTENEAETVMDLIKEFQKED